MATTSSISYSNIYIKHRKSINCSSKLTNNQNSLKHQENNNLNKKWDLFNPLEEDIQEQHVTKIPVTRQKYIRVPKVALVDRLSKDFDSTEDTSNFSTICSCLESILHVEHKALLEELRADTHGLGTRQISHGQNGNGSARHTNRTARFQQNIMLILKRAQFQELSERDLQLTTALNSDYLLTLPIDVDWKSTSSANFIIFRRGYTTEKQEGFLFGAKLDYLQSLVLRSIFNLSKPFLTFQKKEEEDEYINWTEPLRKWLKEPLRADDEEQVTEENLPMLAASKRATPRYEAVLSSAGSRGKLLRNLLVWLRFLPPETPKVTNLFTETPPRDEPYLRPSYITRVSMRDIWLPASERELKGSKWNKLQLAFSIFFSRSKLQEPAFKELVVMHASNGDHVDIMDHMRLELNTYKNIPVPDLKVVFPNKKLRFRLLDTLRLDLATLAGLLAFLVNYRFDDFLSSPSAFVLDIVTTVSLVVFATRVGLGYKQTWDRYQLLVNKTLYEKTVASGFGVVHFLIDASQEQQLKQAILLYGLLLHIEDRNDISLDKLASFCEQYCYENFKEQIEMPVDEAVETLCRLGLVILEQKNIRAVPYYAAVESLERRWQELLKTSIF